MSEQVSRRDFLKLGGGLAAGAGVAVVGLTPTDAAAAAAKSNSTSANLSYPRHKVATARGMKVCTGSDYLDTVLQFRLPFAWHRPDGLRGVT